MQMEFISKCCAMLQQYISCNAPEYSDCAIILIKRKDSDDGSNVELSTTLPDEVIHAVLMELVNKMSADIIIDQFGFPPPKPTGECLHCHKPLTAAKHGLFCNTECINAFTGEQTTLTQLL